MPEHRPAPQPHGLNVPLRDPSTGQRDVALANAPVILFTLDRRGIEFTHQVRFDRLEPLFEAPLFRLVQEALNNIRQHSRAKRARIALTQVDKRIHLEIRDWGLGFDPAGLGFDPAVANDNRYGLQGIRERARLLCGVAVVEGFPGQGTRLSIDLPLAHPPEMAVERSEP